MRIECYPQDKWGCGFYRMIGPANALVAQGHDVVIKYKRPSVITDKGVVVASAEVLKADVMVFQRPARKQYIEYFKVLQGMGIKVVVDIDDDLTKIHPLNVTKGFYDSRDMNWKFAVEAFKAADWITTSTPALAEKFGIPGKTTVIPNCVPERYLNIEPVRDNKVTVGWAGRISNHPKDLQITHGSINSALSKVDARFYALGDQKALFALGIRNNSPHSWSPGVSLEDYPAEVAKFDIGIVPLETSEFNDAKSWLKGLEYASLGVAPIVSPTPDNLRLVDAGAALAAHGPKDWHDRVRRLIESEVERKELAAKAKEFARSWTIEGNTWRWLAAWSK